MARTPSGARRHGAEGDISPGDQTRRTRIRAGALLAALKDVTGVVAPRDTIPVLQHVLIHAEDGTIALTATDLDMWVRRELASDDAGQADSAEWRAASRGFALTLPAKALAAVVGEFDPDAMVTLTAPTDLTETYSGAVAVAAGRARFKLHCLPAAEFPVPPPVDVQHAFELPCSQLADGFAAVEHAVSTEETRFYLNGVFLHPEGLDLRLVATDGSRLARLAFDAPDGGASFPAAILPRRAVAVLDKLLLGAIKAADDGGAPPRVAVEATPTESGARLRFDLPAADGGSIELITKTVDGTFPEYARVIPSAPVATATVDRAALAAAVKRVAVLGDAQTRACRAEFTDDLLVLSVIRPELGEAREELPCQYAGAPMTLGFNSKYLRDALLALAGDSVALGLPDGEHGPVLVTGGDGGGGDGDGGRLVQVLMPMRV